MTVERLRQYRSIIQEIRELTESINKLKANDVVQGSDPEFPYIKHNIRVTGPEQSDKLLALYQLKRAELQAERIKLEAWINNIPDSETRRIFRYRYIEGWSWQKISFRIGHGDESVPRKKHNYFLNCPKNPNCP